MSVDECSLVHYLRLANPKKGPIMAIPKTSSLDRLLHNFKTMNNTYNLKYLRLRAAGQCVADTPTKDLQMLYRTTPPKIVE